MPKNSTRIPTRAAALIVVFLAVLPLALVVAMADDGAISKVAIAYLGVFALLGLFHTHIGAWLDERYVRENPASVRNSDIGSIAVAKDDFSRSGEFSSGKVLMSGETWEARCKGGVIPLAEDELVVVARDDLVLEVQLVEAAQ